MFPQTSAVRENIGQLMGKAASPLFNLGNTIRDLGILPGGISFYANIVPAKHAQASMQTLAQRLSGKGLVRLAPGLWRSEHSMLPDVLSCSVRFHVSPPMEEPAADAQDLILVSARSPWTIAMDSMKTNQSDFLQNKYYGLWPFEIDGKPNFNIRVTSETKPMDGKDRNEKIRRSVEHGGVTLVLEISGESTSNQWQPLVELRLEQEVEINESKVHFWPFHNGLGFKPEGLMQYLRPLPGKVTGTARKNLQESVSTIKSAGRNASKTAADKAQTAANSAAESATTARKASASAAQDAAKQANQTADRAQGLAATALSRVSSTMNEVGNRALQVANTASSRAADLISEVRGRTRRTMHDVEDQATNTLQSAANKTNELTGRGRAAATRAKNQATDTLNRTAKQTREAANKTADRAAATAKETQRAANDIGGRVAKGAERSAREASNAAEDVSKRVNKAANRTANEATSTAEDVNRRVREASNNINEK